MMVDASSMSPDVFTDQPLHDLRAIHDIMGVRFGELQQSRDRAWSVVKITAALYSGSATVIGTYIEAESGRLIDESTGDVVQPRSRPVGIIEEGSWELIDTLGHFTGANRGQYGWTEPRKAVIRTRRPAVYSYSPFAKGGNVLCSHNPSVQGAAQFKSVHLIPRGWETAIRPAYEAFKHSSELFTTPRLPSHYAQLSGMLGGDNSVVAVMAFRTLVENRRVDIPLLKDALGRSHGYRQAAFVYLVLLEPGQIDKNALTSELTTAIAATSARDEHPPIATAIAAARLLHPTFRMPQSLGPKVLTSLRDRATRLAAVTPPDPYLRVVFEIMGLPAN
jgi:hypothetical protein